MTGLAVTGARIIEVPRLVRVADSCIGGAAILAHEFAFDTSDVIVATGGRMSESFAQTVSAGFAAVGSRVRIVAGLRGLLSEAATLGGQIIEQSATLVVAVGGGRAIDVAKLAAARTSTPFISIPTTVAHDGISSPIASLEAIDGVRRSYAAAMPQGVILDTRVLCSAPVATKRAGLGDLISNTTAVADWRLADASGAEQFDEFSALISESAASRGAGIDLTDPLSVKLLAECLLLSGLAMASAGTSRPCSGAEHLISHALDTLLGKDAALHGEQVAVATLFCARLHGIDESEMRAQFIRCGLPSSPGDLGIRPAVFMESVRIAPSMRPARFTILSATDLTPEAIYRVAEEVFDH